jgi:hypothetical protein
MLLRRRKLTREAVKESQNKCEFPSDPSKEHKRMASMSVAGIRMMLLTNSSVVGSFGGGQGDAEIGRREKSHSVYDLSAAMVESSSRQRKTALMA